ncbi:MAG TPA: hypothetical protein VFS22_05795 [Flavisolibacter sp.]|nr:hypothetical protein [Flavisolibacter sp.]
MNEANLTQLKDHLKYMGFGEKLYAGLEHHIRQRFPEFVLSMHSEFGASQLESSLYFSRSKEHGHYLFNHHEAALKNKAGTVRHTFFVNGGSGVSLKEAFNLLEGRSVYRELTSGEGKNYPAWIQLDLKRKEDNGNYRIKQFPAHDGYHLEGTLAKFPIRELRELPQKERLLMSLQKGNLQSVTMVIDGKAQLFFVQANPEYKTLIFYNNGAVRPLAQEQVAVLMTGEGRQKLNGREVAIDAEQQGKNIKQQYRSEKQKKNLPDQNNPLQKNRKDRKKGVTL